MLCHRQAIFEWKGDKVYSSAEYRIRTQGLKHQIAGRLNAHWQTDWAIEDQTKAWTQWPVPMISDHSAHSTPLLVGYRTWLWRYTCLMWISMLWHRQAIFEWKGDKLSSPTECRIWTQTVSGTESPTDWMPAHKPTELSRIKLKTWTRQPVPMISKHSVPSIPLPFGIRTWLWWYTCLLLLISMLWHSKRFSNRKETRCLPLLNAGFEPRVSDTKSPAEWMHPLVLDMIRDIMIFT